MKLKPHHRRILKRLKVPAIVLAVLISVGILYAVFQDAGGLQRVEVTDGAGRVVDVNYQQGSSRYRARYVKANQLVYVTKYNEAVVIYRELIELEPVNPMAHGELGTTFVKLKDLDAAQACYQRALELDPGYVPALYGLGNVCLKQRRFTKAKACFTGALELAPDHTNCHFGMTIACRQLREHRLVVEHGQQFLQLAPASGFAKNVQETVNAAKSQLGGRSSR